MATFYPTELAELATSNSLVDVTDLGGRVRFSGGRWSLAGASVTNNDLVVIGRLPVGARVLPQSNVYASAFGTNGAIEIGDTTDADRFASSTAVASATTVAMSRDIGRNYKVTSGNEILYVKINNKGTATTLTLDASVMYVKD